MKKALAILTAAFLITSGMHVSFASHYCEGKLAVVKLSVTGEKATCGMEVCIPESNSSINSYRNNCCEDHVTAFSLGYYEDNASPELNVPEQRITHSFGTPCLFSLSQENVLKISNFNLSPPGTYCPENLSCPVLGVFRI